MRSIIGEFYLGNITPDVTVIKQTSELKKAVQEMADAESFLPVSYTHLTLPTIYSV